MRYNKISSAIKQVKSTCNGLVNLAGKLQLKKSALKNAALVASAIATMGTANADVLRQNDNTLISLGTPMTGFNRSLSQPVWDLGGVFGAIGFNFIFEHNPSQGATTPIDLTPSSSPDSVLATGFDPNFSILFPAPAPEFQNIPFRDVAIIASPDGSRFPVPMVEDAAPWEASKSFPNDTITLEDWMRVRGIMKIRCSGNGTSVISIKARNLTVNGLYTLWGVFERDFSGDGNIDGMGPSALGGVPNVLIPDETGRASIRRKLNFCPMTEPTLKIVTLAYHSDGNAYGGESELGLAGFPGGTSTHDHISWPINVVEKVLPANQSVTFEEEF